MDFPLSNIDAPGGPTISDLAGQVGDMIFVSQTLLSASIQAAFTPATQIDPERLAFSGYSMGGMTAALAVQYFPPADAVYLMSPGVCGLFLPGGPGVTLDKPSFAIGGDTDALNPFELHLVPLFEAADTPKYLVQIANGSHLGFMDVAPLIEQQIPGALDAWACENIPPIPGPEPALCGLCTNVPTAPQLAAQRHSELTKATALAFFEGYLRQQPLPRAYLQHILEQENPELVVTYSGSSGVGR